jgi:hypothetical protein
MDFGETIVCVSGPEIYEVLDDVGSRRRDFISPRKMQTWPSWKGKSQKGRIFLLRLKNRPYIMDDIQEIINDPRELDMRVCNEGGPPTSLEEFYIPAIARKPGDSTCYCLRKVNVDVVVIEVDNR